MLVFELTPEGDQLVRLSLALWVVVNGAAVAVLEAWKYLAIQDLNKSKVGQ